MFGKLILSSNYAKSINVSSLADGIYLLNVHTENGTKTQKITYKMIKIKKITLGLLITLTTLITLVNRDLPNVIVKENLDGNFNISDLNNKGPIVISFWATWCKPCKKELNNIAEIYEDWQG